MGSEQKYILKRVRSMLALAIPALIVGGLLCLYCLQALETTIIEDSSAISAAIEKNINSRFLELNHFVKSIKISGTNSKLKEMEEEIETVTEDMYRLSVRMKDYRGTNSLAEKMYIYYPGIDYIISDEGCYKSSSYYVLQSPPYREGYESWKEYLLQPHQGELALVDLPNGLRLCYIDQLNIDGKPSMVMVIEINYDTLNDILESYSELENHAACLLLNGQPILSEGDEALVTGIIGDGYVSDTEHTVEKVGENYVFYNSSYFPNFAYLSVYTSQGLLHSMVVVSRVCIICLIACLLVIFVISILIGRRQTASMRNLLRKVNPGEEFPVTDEYVFISQKIDKMIAEKYKTERQIVEYQSQLGSLFLANILQNGGRSEAEIFSIAEKYSVSFDYSQYRVAVLSGELDLAEAEQTARKLQELGTTETSDCLVSYDTDSFFVLINSENTEGDESVILLVKALLDCAFRDSKAHAGIGLCYDSTTNIQESYRQAMTVLELSSPTMLHSIRLFNLSEHSLEQQSAAENGKSATRSRREALIAEQAKSFVDANYCDPLMGLYYVAEHLEVSNSYLSTVFKNVYAIGLIQYVNGLRIEKAKEYILKTDKNIKEIAQLVGFSSDINFIRVFKKYENTTPSSLRNFEK